MDFQKDEEIIKTFIDETREHLTEMEDGILELEKNRDAVDDELVHSMFRAAHSIKAGANLLNFHSIETSAHTLENRLQELRQKKLELTKEIVDIFLGRIDRIRELVNRVRVPENHR